MKINFGASLLLLTGMTTGCSMKSYEYPNMNSSSSASSSSRALASSSSSIAASSSSVAASSSSAAASSSSVAASSSSVAASSSSVAASSSSVAASSSSSSLALPTAYFQTSSSSFSSTNGIWGNDPSPTFVVAPMSVATFGQDATLDVSASRYVGSSSSSSTNSSTASVLATQSTEEFIGLATYGSSGGYEYGTYVANLGGTSSTAITYHYDAFGPQFVSHSFSTATPSTTWGSKLYTTNSSISHHFTFDEIIKDLTIDYTWMSYSSSNTSSESITSGSSSSVNAVTLFPYYGEISATVNTVTDRLGNVTSSVTTGSDITYVPKLNQIVTGENFTCGLDDSNDAYCWGANAEGQLGDSTVTARLIARPVDGNIKFSKLTAGAYHVCGIQVTTGLLYCWGKNTDGQIGVNSTSGSFYVPQLVSPSIIFSDVSAGLNHTCGISSNAGHSSKAYCWGNNNIGQVGNNTSGPDQLTPAAVSDLPSGMEALTKISAGKHFTCGISDSNAAYCWGIGNYGKLGNGSTLTKMVPTAVSGGRSYVRISVGEDHACAIESVTAELYCWGNNSNYQLGNVVATSSDIPVFAGQTGDKFSEVSLGAVHTCGINLSNAVYCWGYPSSGALGNPALAGSTVTPTAIDMSAFGSGVTAFESLSLKKQKSCGILTNGLAFCWGNNSSGEIGNIGTSNQSVPTLVQFKNGW